MNNKKWIVLFIVLLLMLHIELIAGTKTAPETVLINVLTPDGKPDETSICFADIYKADELFVQNRSLELIPSMAKYIDIKKWDLDRDKGYYKLDTGLKGYKGKFKMIVNCHSTVYHTEGIVKLNNTHIPCEMREGKYLIC